MAILAFVAAITTMTGREPSPHFIDKDQAALIERFSDLLSEDPQGKR
jgi:hypothetical protein